jgi:serine/threonine-protein kinase RsbW
VTGSQASRITYTLDSSLDSVNRVEQTAEQVAQKAGFDDDEVFRVSMAAREAAVNAVLHGNAYSPDKRITGSFMDEVEFRMLNPGTELTLIKHLVSA